MKQKLLFWILIACVLMGVCLFALLPLFHSGYFTMHDDEQIARLQQMYVAISQGQFPPRWVPDLGFGFGYPLFNFYPPLVYYLGSLFHGIGFSFIDSTKIVMGLGFFLSAFTMFVWVRKHYGIIPGVFAAILYTYAPYHSVDLYVRGALSEFFSWMWIPIILWSVDMLFETREKKYVVILGIFFALLMLSHTLVMLQFAPLFIIYSFFTFFRTKGNGTRKIYFFILSLILGLGLSAYFWIPSLFEKQYTLVDAILIKELANYTIHFVCPIQLWSSPWGYGGSVAGCVDGLSFQIGKIQILTGVLGILFSTFFIFKKRYIASLAMSVVFLCSIFLTLSYSQFIWNFLKPFWYIQFPWRFLLFVSVATAFLGGFILFIIEKKWGRKFAIVVALVLSLLAIYQVRNDFKPQAYREVADTELTTLSDIQWRVSGMSYEYVPNLVATRISPLGTTELAISQSDIPRKSYTVISGKMSVATLQNISYLRSFRVNVYNQGIIQVNTYNFPGWKVMVDGKQVSSKTKNALDLIQIPLGIGQHSVVATFINTPVRNYANSISVVTLISLLGLGWWFYFKKI